MTDDQIQDLINEFKVGNLVSGRKQLESQLGSQLWDQLGSQLGGKLWSQLWVSDGVAGQLRKDLSND